MTRILEHRYRRLLRLLPAGYRQAWEEDMVTAFMQSADGDAIGRLPLGERLSVVALAVRLRLAGSHTSPRGHMWYQAAYRLALMILLYQALWMTVGMAYFAGGMRFRPKEYQFDATQWVIEWLGVASGLLWIGVFGCAVMGRVVAARIVALFAIGVALFVEIWVAGGLSRAPFALASYALYAALVFAIPRRARPSRRLWIGAYVGASVVLAPAAALSRAPRDWPWIRLIDLTLAWQVGLVIGMIVVLATPALRRSAGWLIAFAGLAVGTLLNLLGLYLPVPLYGPTAAGPLVGLDLIVVVLGVACAVLGVRARRRLPRSVRGRA